MQLRPWRTARRTRRTRGRAAPLVQPRGRARAPRGAPPRCRSAAAAAQAAHAARAEARRPAWQPVKKNRPTAAHRCLRHDTACKRGSAHLCAVFATGRDKPTCVSAAYGRAGPEHDVTSGTWRPCCRHIVGAMCARSAHAAFLGQQRARRTRESTSLAACHVMLGFRGDCCCGAQTAPRKLGKRWQAALQRLWASSGRTKAMR